MPIYERLTGENYKPNVFEKIGLFKGFWERFFVKGVAPKNRRKMKAPAAIQPGQSHIDKSIIDKLVDQNKKIIEYYLQLQTQDLKKVVVSSPFAKIVTYNAACTFDIIALHEQRHLQQAKRAAEISKQ